MGSALITPASLQELDAAAVVALCFLAVLLLAVALIGSPFFEDAFVLGLPTLFCRLAARFVAQAVLVMMVFGG